MKTTLDLPDSLLREIKIRAVHRGQKLKDAIAELLRKGLSVESAPALSPPRIERHPDTGLPRLVCDPASPEEELTPQRVADLLLEQEVGWQHDRG